MTLHFLTVNHKYSCTQCYNFARSCSLTLNKLSQKRMLEERLARKRETQLKKLEKKQAAEVKVNVTGLLYVLIKSTSFSNKQLWCVFAYFLRLMGVFYMDLAKSGVS